MKIKSKTIEEFIKIINSRITDLHFTAGSPMFSDSHRMAARAREDELEWVKSNLEQMVPSVKVFDTPQNIEHDIGG